MRSPRTSPRSAIRARTQPNTVSCTSWGRRLRVFDSQEWSGTRSVISRRRNSRNENESEQRHSIPRSLSIPSKYPTMCIRKGPARRHRGRAHGLGVVRLAGVLHEAVEPGSEQHLLQAVVEHVARRARHLGPRHHQVALTIALPTHRHRQTPTRSLAKSSQIAPTSSTGCYAIGMKDGSTFGLAGVWENWNDPSTGEWVRTFAVITTDANELVSDIHDRMPVILRPEDYDRWLGIEPDPRDLLRPFPAGLMRMWPISTRVNSPKNDDPDLLAPVEPGSSTSLIQGPNSA